MYEWEGKCKSPDQKEAVASAVWVLKAQSAISSGGPNSTAQKVCVGYWTATPDSVDCQLSVTAGH